VELSEKQDGAHEMEEAEEVLGFLLPAGGQPAPSFQPSEEALDLPSPLVSAELAAILGALASGDAATFGGNELNATFLCESETQSLTVPGLVPNQSRWQLSYESSIESSLGEHTVESVSSVNIDSERKTMAVCNCHDLGRPTSTARPHAGPPFFAGT
jgi:hypothetical protein